MPFSAVVLTVLIASPSDTADARVTMRDAIAGWNDLNAAGFGVTMLPKMWETGATPEIGDRTQAIVNRQLVDEADLLIGTFWTRLGTPTGEAPSGTVEEIERFEQSGRPTLLYFADMPAAPGTIDPEQLAAVQGLRASLETRAVIGTYQTLGELDRRVRDDLTRTVWRLRDEGKLAVPPRPSDSGEGRSEAQAPPVPDRSELARDLRGRLRGLISQYQAQFTALTSGQHMDDSRRMMTLFGQELSSVLAAVDTVLEGRDSPLFARLMKAVQDATQLGRSQFRMDGGLSWNRFNKDATQLFDSLSELSGQDWMVLLDRPSSSPA